MTAALAIALSLSIAQAAPPVSITPASVTNVDLGISGGSFDVTLHAQRSGWFPIKLRELDYTIMVAGQEFTSDTVEYHSLWIGRKEPTAIPIHVEFTMAQALAVGLSALSGKKLRVRAKGTAEASVLFFPITATFNRRID